MSQNQTDLLVSVIMPVYNAGDYLRPAILSILNQTYQTWELVIIDDGSTDGCIAENHDIISSDARIKYVFQNNTGKPGALNRGLGIIQGQFWLIQDADDISYPQRIENQIGALMADSSLAAVYCNTDIILPDGRVFASTSMSKDPTECRSLIDEGKIPAHDATGMYRTSMLEQMQFDEELRIGQGVDFVIRVGELFPISVVSGCLYSHRVNYCSVTHSRADEVDAATDRLRRKMLLRRGMIEKRTQKRRRKKPIFKHRQYDTVLPYVMNSVVQHRLCGTWRDGFKTALICISLHPLDHLYYRPLMYCFTPMPIIDYYRKLKKRIHER